MCRVAAHSSTLWHTGQRRKAAGMFRDTTSMGPNIEEQMRFMCCVKDTVHMACLRWPKLSAKTRKKLELSEWSQKTSGIFLLQIDQTSVMRN